MENFLELDGTNGTNKTNGAIFELRVGVYTTENGTDAAEREQRLLADFAEPQGRKAHAVGLKRKAESGKLRLGREQRANLFALYRVARKKSLQGRNDGNDKAKT